jgi:predicted AlkP superfamily pyrophosphatase or phosphodiesterase
VILMYSFEKDFKKQAEFEQNIAACRDGVEQMNEFIPHVAKLYKTYFDALIKEGFTETQAIYLVGQHGMTLGSKT